MPRKKKNRQSKDANKYCQQCWKYCNRWKVKSFPVQISVSNNRQASPAISYALFWIKKL